MPIIHEVATMTAKGQITVPKPIRQALGADTGTEVRDIPYGVAEHGRGVSDMPIIHEVATMTKGSRSIRGARRRHGTKVTFELQENGQVVVSRADAEHEDPAIRAFLGLIEKEIEAGRGVEEIPGGVAQEMLEHAELDIDLDEPIEGDVDL